MYSPPNPQIKPIRRSDEGVATSVRAVAAELNERGILTPPSASRLLSRLRA